MTPYPSADRDKLIQVAGYLNFSAGSRDPVTLRHLNQLHAAAAAGPVLSGQPEWFDVHLWLSKILDECEGTTAAFADVQRARRAVRIVYSLLPPAYLDFHKDLLFHQQPELLFNGLFMGRSAEVVLDLLDQTSDDAEVVQLAIQSLNDFVGYRPVPQLENRICEPYPHEWVAPIPVYYKGVGFSDGIYHRLFRQTLDILKETSADTLRQASFDVERLAELTIDPRAFDFDHPVNKRPNYQFGQWDPHAIDSEGYFYRFVVQQITLDALLSRLDDPEQDIPRAQIHFEAAAVLAGTILMASGVSGWGPGAHTSETTLSSLLAPIARYRDQFYEELLNRMEGEHGDRLREEQSLRQQPFGAARQHLNASLASQRAGQQQHAHLARLYARMGYTVEANEEVDLVQAPASRMMCRIDCSLMQGLASLRRGDLESAAKMPQDIVDRIKRAIYCGAVVDPWDILGFGGNYARFHDIESSVHDHRVDEIIQLTDYLFGYMARVWSEAAARDDKDQYEHLAKIYRETAEWWRQFSAHTIDDLQATDPLESYESAQLVARGLRVWHRGGAAAGDVSFWAEHAAMFDSPRAYALVIDALLERRDFVASQALLIHWLSNSEEVGLRRGNSSWPLLAQRWLHRLQQASRQHYGGSDELSPVPEGSPPPAGIDRPWSLVRRFFDMVEANAESFWSPPQFSCGGKPPKRDWDRTLADLDAELTTDEDNEDDDEDPKDLFAAAYEDVTFRDSTDDGMDGAIFDESSTEDDNQDSLDLESRRIGEHLEFHVALARMWVMAADMGTATSQEAARADNPALLEQRDQKLVEWASQASINRRGLLELLDSVRSYRIKPSGTDNAAMMRYDRMRVVRDALLERIIATTVESSDARRLMIGVLLGERQERAHQQAPADGSESAEKTDANQATVEEGTATDSESADENENDSENVSPDSLTAIKELENELLDGLGEDDRQAVRLYAALVSGDSQRVRDDFPPLLRAVRTKSLLYIPLVRGGDPVKIFVARLRQRVLLHLLRWFPRRGMIFESCQLLEAARMMEQQNPIGPGAVTEFDGLFKIGFRALVQATTHAAKQWPEDPDRDRTDMLTQVLESLTETLLASWLTHSRSLRLSALETVADPKRWEKLVHFIKTYGAPLFCQTCLGLGNIRAILHQGVDAWMDQLKEDPGTLADSRFLADLDGPLGRNEAKQHLTMVYETILDHHSEYLDYTSTTTQSDRGELIYMFLDFLRLRVRYDRIAWNLRPVMWTHEILVRDGFEQAAMRWQRSLEERISAEAEIYVKRLRRLQQQYSMRMPTVADRILERFIQPMTIDRMRGLIEPAIRGVRQGTASTEFELLRKEANLLTEYPTGAGLDLPAWLEALEEEVELAINRQEGLDIDGDTLLTIDRQAIELDDLEQQLSSARRLGRRLPFMEN
ncbi:hypothetical protein FF011L_30930 [Roseimaritima multifibrata]|uniref:Uncharacterized protein n=1 Tax=Roseimaritima multifibrata TaxID=1930274 RepID=A0A517MHF1_9BACT|nr:hypothetical protein [Roseimaritima multifibrata]QDS94314.1 hypothetical protein FF011L_30930 [Roseimaritima multifibrata]